MQVDLFSLVQKRDGSIPDRQVWTDLGEQVRLAERVGFGTAWVAEHHFNTYSLSPSPLVSCAWLAGITERIGLGTGAVILPLYDPVRLVEEIAQVDLLSGGRLVLGIGSGYQDSEFRRFGQSLDESVARTLEVLDVIELAMGGDDFSYDGAYYRVPEMRLAAPALQRPTPPIWVTGLTRSPDVQRRLARSGYVPFFTANWHPIGTFAPVRERYDEVLREVGRDPRTAPLGVLRIVHVTRSRAEARDAVERARWSTRVSIGLRFGYGRFDGQYPLEEPARDEPDVDAMERSMIVGDVDTCVERILEDHAALGHSHLACNIHVGGMPLERTLRTIEALGEEVMPAVNAELARRGVPEAVIEQAPAVRQA